MIIYKGETLFLTPTEFSTGDIEFNIHDSDGNLVGTNFLGIADTKGFSNEEVHELEELILSKTFDMEIQMKFYKSFNCEIKKWTTLSYSKVEILKIMEGVWNIPKDSAIKYIN